jgi:peptidoglycan/LPS O-acetylase OafA/YrhL
VAAQNNFHFVRLAAASLVVFGQSYGLLSQSVPDWLGVRITAFAVRIFFVVSGYLVCESWNRDASLHRYLWRRSLRILPGLAVAVALSALVLGPLLTERSFHGYFHDPQFAQYFWNIALAPHFNLPGVFSHNAFDGAVNGSIWTLPAEFAMCLLLPLYGTAASPLCRRLLLPMALIGLGAAGYVLALRPAEMQPAIWGTSVPQLLRWAPYFLAGAAVRAWRLERFLNLHAAVMALGVTAWTSGSIRLHEALLLLVIPYAVLAFCLTPNPWLGRFGRHADISYGVYLYSFPIQQVLIAWFGPGGLRPLALTAVAMPLSWLCGFASWHAIEKRALRLKPHRPGVTASPMASRTPSPETHPMDASAAG